MQGHQEAFVIDNDLRQRLQLLTGANEQEQFSFPNFGNYADIINLLKEIPLEIFEAFAKREKAPELPPSAQIILNKLKYRTFENWGETVSTNYNRILYPTQTPAQQGTQVTIVQDFVKEKLSGLGTKRVRGAGIRHSWSNVFADENQFLVSLYPYRIATGTSFALESWAKEMLALDEELAQKQIQHLCSIRHLGTVTDSTTNTTSHLVKVGAGVSNEQMRLWCIKNGYQYKSNVIMVEVNVCGAIGTCSHGAGINTQTLSDYIYEIEFIDKWGVRHTISKAKEPELIRSAASNLGLLGIIIYVTLEMDELDIVEFQPRNTYKDFTVPWPRNYQHAESRKQKPQYVNWAKKAGQKSSDEDWENNFRLFKQALHKSYCEWFYFPIEGTHVFENCFNVYAKKTPENIQRLHEENAKNRFLDVYPLPIIQKLSEFALFVGNIFINHEKTQHLVSIFMRSPFAFFPNEHVFVNYPDGVHFQRGIQNMKVRDIEVEINVPSINGEPDYDLIQRLWWVALQIVEPKKDLVNVALEMRIFKGSNATLAPEIGYEYVCSIEILRSMTFNEEQEAAWRAICLQVFDAWKNERDSNGKQVAIRPHWGKEWNSFPEIKQHVLNDEDMKVHFRKFLDDYHQIGRVKKFNSHENLKAFSNSLYRELLNNAIGTTGPHIP